MRAASSQQGLGMQPLVSMLRRRARSPNLEHAFDSMSTHT